MVPEALKRTLSLWVKGPEQQKTKREFLFGELAVSYYELTCVKPSSYLIMYS